MAEDSADGGRGQPDPVAPPGRPNRTVTPAIAGALVVLAASFALSVSFVLSNGGLDLPAAERPSSSNDAGDGASPSTAAATATTVADASVPAPSLSPTVSPVPATATATPGATATVGTTPVPTPSAVPTPGPSSNRYDLLTKCTSTPDCWIYVVREGDNLFSIARYFGVPLSVVEERNPWTKTTQLVAGQELLLPPPTR